MLGLPFEFSRAWTGADGRLFARLFARAVFGAFGGRALGLGSRSVEELLLAWFSRNATGSCPGEGPGTRTRSWFRSYGAADADRARRAAVGAVARALADGRRACGGVRCGRDPRVAGARLQPARARAAPRGAAGRGARLAGRSHRAARRRALHRGRRRLLRVRARRAAGRRERPPRDGANGRGVRAGGRAGADGSRRDGLSRAGAALRRLPARGGVPVTRPALRAAAEAGARSRARSGSAARRRSGSSPPPPARSPSSTRRP